MKKQMNFFFKKIDVVTSTNYGATLFLSRSKYIYNLEMT